MRAIIFIVFFGLLNCKIYSQGRENYSPTIIKQDSKYGISDAEGNIVVKPLCDTIYPSLGFDYKKSRVSSVNPFFILKKENKVAFAYLVNLNNVGRYVSEKKNQRWEISEFIYDEIKECSFGSASWSDTTTGYMPEPFLILQYKKNEKWGMMYVIARSAWDNLYSYPFPAGLGKLLITEAKYDTILDHSADGIYHIKLNEKYGLSRPFINKKRELIDTTYNDWFDTIPLLISTGIDEYKPFFRTVKKNGKWGVIKINPEIKLIEYIIPCINESSKEIKYTYPFEVFYTKKAVNDTILINDTKNNIQLRLNIPTQGDLEVYIAVLIFYSNNNTQEKENKKRYLMLGLNHSSGPTYIYKVITIIDTNGNIIATYNDSKAEYILHKNQWGALISKKIANGKQWTHEFFDVETGEKMFTIKTESNSIISSCELDIPKIPLVAIENGKKDKMVGYYDFLTKKYYKENPKKDERCHGF